MDATQQTVVPAYTPPPGVFGTKIPATVAFAIGVLLFFLPFAEIRCNGSVLANNSGFGIAIGSQWKMASGGLFGKNGLGGDTDNTIDKKKKQSPNIYAIAALGLGLLGLILAFVNGKAAAGGGLISGVLSAVALVLMMIDLKKNTDLKTPDTANPGAGGTGLDSLNNIKLSLVFTPWFYVAVVIFLVAAFFCFKRMKTSSQ